MLGSLGCTASNIALPVIDGLNFQPLQADLVTGYSTSLPDLGSWVGHDALNITNLSFCNVSLTYTHTGHTEPVHTHVYLPLESHWNQRMVGVGGMGWAAGLFELSDQQMAGAVSEGYVAVSTDAGGDPWHPYPENWALRSDGTVNMYLIENFGHRALGDTATIGKAIAKNFYGSAPKYSYWKGCSQGGRQGYVLAQKYPGAYDGILALSPALNYPSLLMASFATQFMMNYIGEYPHECEFDALRKAAVAACDHEDGIADGIISDPSACLSKFDPSNLVGTTIPCNTTTGKRGISETAVIVAQAAWTGPKLQNDVLLWHGLSPDANLVGDFGNAKTRCTDNTCHSGHPPAPVTSFITHMVRRNLDLTAIKPMGYALLFNEAKILYDRLLASNDPDLSKFRDKGGKMISIHGLADEMIPPAGTQKYFESVIERDPAAREYFRYYDAPGVGHCSGGAGPIPTSSFADLVAWVENGRVPDTLLAKSLPNANGETMTRPLCTYPLIARYAGTGDSNDPRNFYCAEEYLSATPIKLVWARAKKAFGIKSQHRDEL